MGGFTFSMDDYIDEQLKDKDDPSSFITGDGSAENLSSLSVPKDAYTENPMMRRRARPTMRQTLKPRKTQSSKTDMLSQSDSRILETLDETDLRMTIHELNEDSEEQGSDEDDRYSLSSLKPTRRPSSVLHGAANNKKPQRRRSSAYMSHLDPVHFMEEVDIRMSLNEHEDEAFDVFNTAVMDMDSLHSHSGLDDVPPVTDEPSRKQKKEAKKSKARGAPASNSVWDGDLSGLKRSMPSRRGAWQSRSLDKDNDKDIEHTL